MKTVLRRACGIFLYSSVLLAIGCVKKTTPPDEIVIGISAPPVTLDPRFATDAYGAWISHLIFNGLVQVGRDLEVAPDAARTWTFKNGVYTLELVPGLKFHNGRLVTAEDLLFSYEQFTSKSSPFASSFSPVQKFEASAAGDHLRVKITMKNFVANFLGADLAMLRILPKKEIDEFPKKLVGTGPFRLVSKTDSDVYLEAVKDHPIQSPQMPRANFKVVHDDFTRYQKLLKGELDVVLNDISNDKVHVFEERPAEFRVYRVPSASTNFILLNMKDPIFANREVRRALSQSIHRSEIIQYKHSGMAAETTAIIPRQHKYYNTELQNPPYDLAAAKQTIEKLGMKGRKLILKCSNNPGVMDISKVLAYQLSQSGLDVEMETYEWGKFYEDVKAGHFQMATMKWVGISDPDIYRNAFNSKEKPPGGRNRGNYNNPLMDELTERARVTENESQRKELYFEIQKIALEDFGYIPLWAEIRLDVMKKTVTGFEPSIMGDFQSVIHLKKSQD